jgi:hypothetical protein
MFRRLLLAAAALLAGGLATPARADLIAVPVTDQLIAGGRMTAVLVYVEAADRSTLRWDQPGGAPPALLFTNTGPSRDPIGTTRTNFGAAGPVDFILNNASTGRSFTTGLAGPRGVFHARASQDFADFDVGALPTAAAAAILAVTGPAGPGPHSLFIGFEDRACSAPVRPDGTCAGSDLDFNDLIYWFRPLRLAGGPQDVPAPAALALFGMGLLGLGALARRRRA